jgi:hypothetical protein
MSMKSSEAYLHTNGSGLIVPDDRGNLEQIMMNLMSFIHQ